MALLTVAIAITGCSKDNEGDKPQTYDITVTDDGHGTAKATVGGADAAQAAEGATVTLTADPKDGYVFKQWTVVSGDVTLSPDATTNPATFTMPANAVSVKAEFAEVPKQYSIYLAGYYQNDNDNIFGYTLVNGVQTDLPAPAGGSKAKPVSMAVASGKTYVAGEYFDSDGGWARACYWSDGTVTKLDGPADRGSDQPDYVNSITVSDDKVYAAGFYMNDSKVFPCYWVDGALNTLALPGGTSFGATYAIAVSGSKVYAAGYSYGSARIPGYWNDGVFVSLDIPAGATFQISNGMGIAVSDKVYVMGNYKLNSVNYPCVWADGERTDLAFDASATGGAIGRSLAVSDGKVYVLGYPITNDLYKACYWVDGTRTDLDTPVDMYSDGWSIGVIDGKVYVGGRYYDRSYAFRPCYWFDGQRTDLDVPTGGTQASIMGIYISE